MPELPEVQTTVNGINKALKGLTITDVWTNYASQFHANKDNIKNPAYFSRFKKEVLGAKIEKASRRGKNVLIHLSNRKTILVHMKMTGHIMYGTYTFEGKKEWVAQGAGPLRDDPFNRFIRFVLSFSSGKQMALSDMRRFAKVTLIDTERMHESPHLSSHGPEPLEKTFGTTELIEAMSRKLNAPIKLVLMNHQVVSGIGNIYSDEILWRSGIHPLTKIKDVPNKKWPEVLRAIKETLKKGIDFGGDSMSDYRNIHGERGEFQDKHSAYRKTGTKCTKPKCRGVIERIKLGGRSAHFCDTHQRLYT